jgi:hypothetical protein
MGRPWSGGVAAVKLSRRVVGLRLALALTAPLPLLPFVAPPPDECCDPVDPGILVLSSFGALYWLVLLPLVLSFMAVGPSRLVDGVLVVPTLLWRRRLRLDLVRRVHGSYEGGPSDDGEPGHVFLLLRTRWRFATVVGERGVVPADVRAALDRLYERDHGLFTPTAAQVREGLSFERWPAGHRSGRFVAGAPAAWILTASVGSVGSVLLQKWLLS